jgi:prepilin-type N-terminal cleavage/methylation domain-containing protein
MRFISRLRRDERGMTMIELLVAATICAVGIAATIGVMDQSRTVAVKSEQRDAMAHQAERELERLLELPWANLGHGAAAPTSADSPYAGTPSGGNFAYDRSNTSTTEPLLTLGSPLGQVPSTYSTWSDAATRMSGRVYRYVTRISANARRITVVVTANGAKVPTPVLLSSIKTEPLT